MLQTNISLVHDAVDWYNNNMAANVSCVKNQIPAFIYFRFFKFSKEKQNANGKQSLYEKNAHIYN